MTVTRFYQYTSFFVSDKVFILTFLLMLSIVIYTLKISTPTSKSANTETYNSIIPTIKDLLHLYGCLNSPENVYRPAYNNICPNFGKNIEIVFVVTSSPANEEARNNIRKTWGTFSSRRNLGLGFIIGSIEDQNIEQKLKTESLFYGDLIRFDLLDTYNNLTLKTTLMLKWVAKYCSKAAYIFKVDDDVFLNVNLLLDLKHQKKIIPNRTIYGRLVRNWIPVRDKKSKYYISPFHFSPETFPDFTTGPAYIFSSFLALELLNEALNLSFIELEDVFYTGIVASRINVSLVNIPEIVNRWLPLNDCNIYKSVSLHDVKRENVHYVWYRINTMDKNKCKSLPYILLQKVKTFFSLD